MVGMTSTDTKERFLPDMPPAQGLAASTHCFVDLDHVSNKVTHCSQEGILIFVYRAPIVWYSK